jgi:hypothetical protein
MTILVVTPYAGSEKLVRMTERMLDDFGEISNPLHQGIDGLDFWVVAINNAAERPIKTPVAWHGHFPVNEGFGVAVNLAIRREVFDVKKHLNPEHHVTDVLVLNNDLEFPDKAWLKKLLDARDGRHVLSPCTDITATKMAVAECAHDLDPVMADQVSAFCWLVPVPVIEQLRKRYGFELFSPEFTNYGSDDITGACLRRIIGQKPFKVVQRSWVKHKKAQTANELGIKAGTPDLLLRIRNWKRNRRLS